MNGNIFKWTEINCFWLHKRPIAHTQITATLFSYGKFHMDVHAWYMQSNRKGNKTRNQTTIRIFPFNRERSQNHLRWAPKTTEGNIQTPIFELASEFSGIYFTIRWMRETKHMHNETTCRGFGFSFAFFFIRLTSKVLWHV